VHLEIMQQQIVLTAWATKLNHRYKFITPVYDDVLYYHNVQFFIWSKTGILNTTA